MPFKIIRDDLTRVKVDAIVNAANESLLGGGGVDGAIHAAAGPELLAECRTLGGCATGQAVLTKGYQLPAKYVIHTVGPIWQDGKHHEAALLANCYRNSLALAKEHNLESVAFPLISSGIYGYPKDQALATAIAEISQFLLHNDMDVTLVVFDPTAFQLSGKLFNTIQANIDDWFFRHHEFISSKSSMARNLAEPTRPYKNGLADLVDHLDESFSHSLLRRIDEKGMTDVQAYRKANVTRQVFSRIRSNPANEYLFQFKQHLLGI